MKELTQLENELNVIGKICDCLKYGSFQGTHAQDVAIGQMYLQGLYQNLAKMVKEAKEKPVESPPQDERVVKSNPEPVVDAPTVLTEANKAS